MFSVSIPFPGIFRLIFGTRASARFSKIPAMHNAAIESPSGLEGTSYPGQRGKNGLTAGTVLSFPDGVWMLSASNFPPIPLCSRVENFPPFPVFRLTALSRQSSLPQYKLLRDFGTLPAVF
ncbi:MAG: hypothetical protein ABIS50_08690 [Luteolibacter sp.]|uniref:hypothetical protein n=1 Tax=Luteolibacter sp. TaxID=1962973 RepID=UPI003264E658